ncbi:MAG: FitA-like ribbon-helix-helix domain-containing protein [Beijerinckiaceae bacterium]
MTRITISDVDDALVEKIRNLAKEHNHSFENEIRDLLRQAVEAKPRSKTLIEIANAIAALTPSGVPQTDSVILLREDRNR